MSASIECRAALLDAAEDLEEAAELLKYWGGYATVEFRRRYQLAEDVHRCIERAARLRQRAVADD